MTKPRFLKFAFAMLYICLLAVPPTSAQYAQLHMFSSADAPPTSGVTQGFDGHLYGTTYVEAYRLNFSVQHVFCYPPNSCPDGSTPFGGLLQARNGNFYGVTAHGGNPGCGGSGCGTVFSMTPSGVLTTLYRFAGSDGAGPSASLIQAADGSFYGTTASGGANNAGTVFRITTAGKLKVLYSFCAQINCLDGSVPASGLLQASNGLFYGVTSAGGTNNLGTIFKLTPTGKLATLHSFAATDGSPSSALIQAKDGRFLATTWNGGAYGFGTIFRISAAGSFATLYSFCAQGQSKNCPDGANPSSGLVESVQGTLFGTTYNGGICANGAFCVGTLFGYSPSSGSLVTEYVFGQPAGDGQNPAYTLIEGTDGALYGTTASGGIGYGTAYQFYGVDQPFVGTNPTSGKVGATVTIFGYGLTSATKVTFGSQAAAFAVVSDTEITTTVPAGATSGEVSVTTPSGALNSRYRFKVIPQISGFTPTNGPVETTVVTITGMSLTQTSKVTFGGVAAMSFTVVSDTEVKATVPTGAKTGKIGITTQGGSATSVAKFTVT